MRTLFFKIFVSFWLSHLVVVALLYSFLINALDSRDARDSRRAVPLPSQLLAHHARASARAFESGGAPALDAYLDLVRAHAGLQAALLGAPGRSLSAHPIPRRGTELARVALGSGEGEFAPMRGPDVLGARAVRGASGALYVFVAQTQSDAGNGLGRWVRRQIVQLIAVLIGAGLVAWGLAKYFSAPLLRLRQATQQFAEGDFSVRVGPSLKWRSDEIAELGRDFDLMAERISDLMSSERRLLEAERRQAEAQRRLLADISHELRSPLARIAFALELAGGAQDRGDPARKYLERIERESALLNDLIGHLLTLARLESGGEITRGAQVDLAGLVAEVCEDADFEAQRRQAHVQIVRLDGCRIEGAPELLRSAVENVVRNAVRYTPERTSVEVSLECDECEDEMARPEAVIRVRDWGPGVPEGALEAMFRPFYRVEDARDRQSGGTGLGLSITERAVRLHGGSVRAWNADGGGLEIEMRLPLSERCEAVGAEEQVAEAAST